jgi:glycosyltransferase involved in cell wall biosynthesis
VVKAVAFAVPGDLATQTGGYGYDRRIIAELETLGFAIEVIELGGEFPRPSAAARAAALRRLGKVSVATPLVIDGLAFGALPDAAAALGRTHRILALVHHPLACETGLSFAEAEGFRATERAALAQARHVIATSPTTARLLVAEYGVAQDKITVAVPGQDQVSPSAGSTDGLVRLLSVGTIVQRKGFDVLLEALTTLGDLPWRLVIVGDRDRDRAATARLDGDIARLGLAERVRSTGAVSDERLAALYAGADVFVLASRFEGYGIAFAEALAHGLPVVGTKAGAIPETVPDGTGVLVPPDDPAALAAALRALINSTPRRAELAAAARLHARKLPAWRDSARLVARAIESNP